MRTYVFRIAVDACEDGWTAYCPALLSHGASAACATREGAVSHLQAVVSEIVKELESRGDPIPEDVLISPEPLILVCPGA